MQCKTTLAIIEYYKNIDLNNNYHQSYTKVTVFFKFGGTKEALYIIKQDT